MIDTAQTIKNLNALIEYLEVQNYSKNDRETIERIDFLEKQISELKLKLYKDNALHLENYMF